ncbi:MAG: transferase [Pseudomonadota bacterium]
MITGLGQLLQRITQRVNINLREQRYDVTPFVEKLIPVEQMVNFHGFYGITPHYGFDYEFRHSSLAGSYFLGKCIVINSILYKSDIRGDELKKKGDMFWFKGIEIPISKDESIVIENSFLIKTLVHSHSRDPLALEKFSITNTVSSHYANIHGAPIDGSFLGPFATVDRTTMNDCVVGAFSYIQTGEIRHFNIAPGTIWIRDPGKFNFIYRYPQEKLRDYIQFDPGNRPLGIFINFIEDRKEAFQNLFNRVEVVPSVPIPDTASLDRFAVIKPKTYIGENVLVAQRAFLQNSWLGEGTNVQENCYVINSHLEGYNVAAHGAKIIEVQLGSNSYVGYNSFLQGRPGSPLTISSENIILPHTIIDIDTAMTIPPGHLVWGLITHPDELETHSMPLDELSKIEGGVSRGRMSFEGKGNVFVGELRNRILHTLAANGAFYNGSNEKGHAQNNQNISFNTIQPYPEGHSAGIYPTIIIRQAQVRP